MMRGLQGVSLQHELIDLLTAATPQLQLPYGNLLRISNRVERVQVIIEHRNKLITVVECLVLLNALL
jgi:hypothetical protein